MTENLSNKDLIQFSFNDKGGYFIYNIKVQRGIKGKSKSKVDEVLIVGIPKSAMEHYCNKNNLYITNKAVYDSTDDNPLLLKEENSWVYKRREDL